MAASAFENLTDLFSRKSKPYLVAHRGNRVACPENTLAAFRQALTDGADLLETDLHLTADGAFVCVHDATVDRTTDSSGAVAGMTLAQLKTLSAYYGRPEFHEESVPTLAEVAALLPDDVGLALELKTDRFLEPEVARRLADELAALGVRNRTLVMSFSLARSQSVATAAPDLPVGFITVSRPWPIRGAVLLGVFWPLLFLNPFYPFLAHRRSQLVAPLDPTPDRRLWFYRLVGCDAILSDDPGSTRRAMQRVRDRK